MIVDSAESDKKLILGLTYLNYATNRDKGMSHSDIIEMLPVSSDTAKEFDEQYIEELTKLERPRNE